MSFRKWSRVGLAVLAVWSMGLVARAWALESLEQGVTFLSEEAREKLSGIADGRFAILPFVEEPDSAVEDLSQPSNTAGLGISISNLLADRLQEMGMRTVNRSLLVGLLRDMEFKVEDLGNPERLSSLFEKELDAVLYGRMRVIGNGTVVVGIDAVRKNADGQIEHLPQGRNITVGMTGDMYALCAMNGVLEINQAAVQRVTGPSAPVEPEETPIETADATSEPVVEPAEELIAVSAPAIPDAPMLIAAPLQPQLPAPPVQPYNLEILVDDAALPCYKDAAGNFYVAAEQDKAYQVRLTNNTESPVAVALLIDGLSAIGKERALPVLRRNFALDTMPEVDKPSDTYKYIVAPNSKVIVKGWQIDERIARDFVFMAAENSVAGRKDFWDHIGNISASVYPLKSVGEPGGSTSKGLEIGTGEGKARINPVALVDTVYDPNPAAVLGVFYETPEAVASAGMTLVE